MFKSALSFRYRSLLYKCFLLLFEVFLLDSEIVSVNFSKFQFFCLFNIKFFFVLKLRFSSKSIISFWKNLFLLGTEVFFITLHSLRCIHYIEFITLHSLHCIRYIAFNTLHSLHCIHDIAFIALHSLYCCITLHSLLSLHLHCIHCIACITLGEKWKKRV